MSPVVRKSTSVLTEARREILHAVSWRMGSNTWSPPTDLYETEESYVVRVEIAGLREEDFEVSLQNNTVSISGYRPDFPERRAYHQMEIRFGKFATAIGLPGPVNADEAHAEYKEGFLTVTLPKAKQNQGKVE